MNDPVQFTGRIIKDEGKGAWTYVLWNDSQKVLGTRRPRKVNASVNDIEFKVTCMPMGDGTHMVPIRKEVMEQSRLCIGEEVTVFIWKEDTE
jgi:hypothetical protein